MDPEPQHAHSGLRGVLANFVHLAGGKVGAGIVSLGYLIIVARSLGAADYGVLILVHSYTMMVGTVIAFSGWNGVVRYGTIAAQDGDQDHLLRIVRLMAMVEAGFGFLAILVAASIAPIIGPRLGWSDPVIQFAMIYSVAVIAPVRATPQGIIQLLGRFDLLGLHTLVSPLSRLIGAVLVWSSGGGLFGYLMVWLVSAIAECLSLWAIGYWAMERLYPDYKLRGPIAGVLERHAGFVRFNITTNMDITLRELAPSLAPLIVGWMLGPSAAGTFSLAQRAGVVFQHPAKILSNASYAVLAKIAVAGDFRKLRRTVLQTLAVSMSAAIPLLMLIIFFAAPLLQLLGGKTFTGGVSLLVLLAVAQWVMLSFGPLTAGVTAMGFPSRSIITGLVTNIAFLPVLIFMLSRFGLDGAGWHLIAQGVAAVALMLYFFMTLTKRQISLQSAGPSH